MVSHSEKTGLIRTHGCMFLPADVEGDGRKLSQSIAEAMSGFWWDPVDVVSYDAGGSFDMDPKLNGWCVEQGERHW